MSLEFSLEAFPCIKGKLKAQCLWYSVHVCVYLCVQECILQMHVQTVTDSPQPACCHICTHTAIPMHTLTSCELSGMTSSYSWLHLCTHSISSQRTGAGFYNPPITSHIATEHYQTSQENQKSLGGRVCERSIWASILS